MEDIQQILQENALLKAQILLKEEQILLKEQELLRKKERILYLERQLFGRRSEKRLPDYPQAQLSLFDSEQGMKTLELETPEMKSLVDEIMHKAEKRRSASKEKSTTKKRSYKVPQNIERRETVVDPDNVDVNTMIRIGQDVNERLMIEPSKFWVERIVRPIYKEKQEVHALATTIVQAPLRNVILPGCIAGESLLSQIIVDKFLYHLPEYRQAKRFKDLGLEITTSSINRWVHSLADKLYPLYAAQMQRVLSSNYIQVDETIRGANFLSLPALSDDEIFRETFESDEEKIISFDRFNVSVIQILSLIVCKFKNNFPDKKPYAIWLRQLFPVHRINTFIFMFLVCD